MKYAIYDANGNLVNSGTTIPSQPGNGTGSTPLATYDRMDIGILSLQQNFQPMDLYDFRVPGDPNQRTFQYKFPRNGFLLGVSLTGSLGNQTTTAGVYVQKTDGGTGQMVDVMAPSDTGNSVSYDSVFFPLTGKVIMAPNPVPFNALDVASMKFKSLSNSPMTVNLAGFLIIGLAPQ